MAKFTPEVLLSAPRRSAGRPNKTGTKALFTVSTYSFETHSKTGEIRVLDIQTGNSAVLYDNLKYSEPTWLTEDEFVFFESADGGRTNLRVADASRPGSAPGLVASLPGAVSNLKVRALSDGFFALACSAKTTRDGQMANADNEDKPSHSSARVYSSLYVRHWDTYTGDTFNAIWYGGLRRHQRGNDAESAGVGPYSLQPDGGLVNALAGTKLSSPVAPFGGTGDFDIGPKGLAFVARDPELSPAIYTKSDLYFLPVENFAEPPPSPPTPRAIRTGDLRGYSASPAFSHGGSRLAFTRMRHVQYESDKPRILVVDDVADNADAEAREFYRTDDGVGAWDASPDSVLWSADDAQLFVTADQRGRSRVWRLSSEPARADAEGLPVALADAAVGSVSEVALLAASSDKLFVSGSSLVDNSWYAVLDAGVASSERATLETVSSNSEGGRAFGLSRSQVDEIWFRGAGDYDVHAWVVTPSGFDRSGGGQRLPLALLVHGGPQGAWGDAWSTRWNPAVFAEQGYVVVCPNPTGSTGYGTALQDAITGDWGGKPYNDLVNCFEHVTDHLAYVDTENAVALGASYGGYMINWIQGHPLGRKFKALVCHDGVFSTLGQWNTEELFFPIHDFKGTLWENRRAYEEWDPAAHTGEWATPELIIHNELDYRLPITEGLAAFNVLQARGIPSRLLSFPDENHWVLKPENSLVWHREVLDWINKYTGAGAGKTAVELRPAKTTTE